MNGSRQSRWPASPRLSWARIPVRFARTSVRRGEVQSVRAPRSSIPRRSPAWTRSRSRVRQTRRSLRPAAPVPRGRAGACPTARIARTPPSSRCSQPLTDAGFRVDRVVTPCNALAALARLKASRGEGSTCWLAINRGGVAIVVVRPGKLLYAHSFVWDSHDRRERQPGAAAAALFARLVPRRRSEAGHGGGAQVRHAGRRGRHVRQSSRTCGR